MTTVRAATAADVPALVALEAAAFPLDAWSTALVADGVRGAVPTASYLVAERDSRVVGYAVVSVVQDVAELQRIATDADIRRTGVATALLAAVIDHASRLRAERLLLEVRHDNAAALALYARTGFAEMARRARYYRDGSAALVLERPLTITGRA